MHYILIANYGNHSLAALQYLIEHRLDHLHLIYVDTGWAASNWPERVNAGRRYAEQHHVDVHHVAAPANFEHMVKDRKQFPSSKFQWCAGFLKGLALSDTLDKIDPFCEATVVSGKRRLDSKRFSDLQEFIEDDDFFNGRRLWHPLWQTDDTDFHALIERSGFDFLLHPSQECAPCIHSSAARISALDNDEIQRLDKLEQQLGSSMFEYPVHHYQINKNLNAMKDTMQMGQFDLGCGSPWCCGE